jgi:hypothetical protein
MRAEEIREQSLAFLEARGFHPARWLPPPDVDREVRPAREIAARLMALDAFFTWVNFSEADASAERVRRYIDTNRLRDFMSADEDDIVSLPREEANEAHADSSGWKLENMWPLAWALGFEDEPTIEASEIDVAISRAIIFEFLPGLGATVEDLVRKHEPRRAEEVIALEDRFYCAHNAVRSAQLGSETVPKGFHPVLHGGAVHERRHALTWCLSPGVSWEKTDLST